MPVAEVVPPSVEKHSGSWLGSAACGRITGDIVSPIVTPDEWEAAK